MAGRLAVVGDLVEDVVVWLEEPLQRGSDAAARVFRSPGGSAANVAVAAAAFVPTRFVGCVGADPLGDRLVGGLADAGVEPRVQRRGRTGSIVVLVEPDGERTFLPDRAAAADLDEPPDDVLDGVAALHVPAYGLHGGRTADTARRLLGQAVERGVAVSVDASSWALLRALGAEQVRALLERLPHVVLLANADEARELDLRARPPAGVTLVLKDGAGPTTVLTPDGGELRVPVRAVDGVRDSTGAGDAFAAGWLSATMEGLPPVARVERGHALARQVLASPGAGRNADPEARS